MKEFWRRLRYFVQRDRLARELEEEMRLHLEMRAERIHQSRVLPGSLRNSANDANATPSAPDRGDAYREARREFGNVTTIQQRSLDMWGLVRLEDVTRDVRFAARRLVQRPAFSGAVIAVIAIGIGATTAMFSAVDAALLRPLPFRAPEELVVVPEVVMPSSDPLRGTNDLNLLDIRGYSDLFANVAAYVSGAVNLADASNPLRLNASAVTPEFFQTLGVAPIQGRVFTADELASGSIDFVLMSYGLWQRQYGGRDIATLTVTLNSLPHRVIGVMPDGFSFPSQSDLWVPHPIRRPAGSISIVRGANMTTTLARLTSGVSAQHASQQMMARWQQRAQTKQGAVREELEYTIRNVRQHGAAIPLRNLLIGDKRNALLVLLGATGLLLLVACGNVTNLLLAQASLREREIAMRRVLGATRGRVVRQLLAESLMLSLCGAVAGVGLAVGALELLKAIMPPALMGVSGPIIDLRVLGFATMLAAGSGLLFGLWPAIGSTRRDSSDVVKSGGGRGATQRGAARVRRVLVAGELALTTTLLVGAALMSRSLDKLLNEDAGLVSANVGTVELALPTTTLSRADRLRRIDEMLSQLSSTPGIEAAGAVNALPLSGVAALRIGIHVDGIVPSAGAPQIRFLQASEGYFDAMRIRLLAGRMFNATDDSLAPKVAIVSAKVANYYWPGQNAVGRMFKGPGPSGVFTVVGVVSDLREQRLEDAPSAQLYLPVQSQTPTALAIVARSTLAPKILLRRMNDVIRSVDRSQAVFNLRMMQDVIGSAVAARRTNTMLIVVFAFLGLLLASVGVYAVVAFGISSRAKELGIRSALGATGTRLLVMISQEIGWVALVGISTGIAGAWALARALQAMLYSVEAHDPLSFALVPLVLLVPVALAIIVPAMRALRVNPAEVMRAD